MMEVLCCKIIPRKRMVLRVKIKRFEGIGSGELFLLFNDKSLLKK